MNTLNPAGALQVVGYRQDQRFFTRITVCIAALIVFSFAQFGLRGMVDYGAVPWWVHAHAAVMMSWLALLIAQNRLAESGNIRLHARLGWAGLVLAVVIGLFGLYSGQMAIALDRVPPFFTHPFFLALTAIEALAFTATVLTAIALRRQTEWHRRLIVVSLIIIMEPAFGRLLPMPLLGDWGEWVVLVLQLVVLGVAATHDHRTLGHVHPASWLGGLWLVVIHVSIQLVARTGWAAGVVAGLE